MSPSPIRYNSPGGLAAHLSHKVTSKSSKEAAASAAAASSTSGLRLSNLTPPGSRKFGTYSLSSSASKNYERSDGGGGGCCSAVPVVIQVKTPPVSRKVGTNMFLSTGKRIFARTQCAAFLAFVEHAIKMMFCKRKTPANVKRKASTNTW